MNLNQILQGMNGTELAELYKDLLHRAETNNGNSTAFSQLAYRVAQAGEGNCGIEFYQHVKEVKSAFDNGRNSFIKGVTN